MEIKTRFNVGDIVMRHTDSPDNNSVIVHEIMTIQPDVCYIGVQIFYNTRTIFIKNDGYTSRTVHAAHGIHRDGEGKLGWNKYREDELVPAPKWILDFLSFSKTSGRPSGIQSSIENYMRPDDTSNDTSTKG